MAGKIFINYRRGDDPGFAQALFGRLEQAFPADRLFMDIDNIEPGLDFVRVLEEQVAQCDVLISVIGRGWIDARDETGARRLDNPDDFVRLEIESALAQDKRVIPVLVGQAQMPRVDQLPESMRPLARRNAVRLSHERFKSDSEGLILALQRLLESIQQARRLAEEERQAEVESEQRLLAELDAKVRDVERRQREKGVQRQKVEAERQKAAQLRLRDEAKAKRRLDREQRRAASKERWLQKLRAWPLWMLSHSMLLWVPLICLVVFVAVGAWHSARSPGPGTVMPSTPAPKVTASSPALKSVTPTTIATLSQDRERALKSGYMFKECSNCPQMIVVKSGAFAMGSPPSEPWRFDDEGPQHRVVVRRLAVGQFEVTFNDWDACVADGGCNGYKPSDAGWGRGTRPVINVNWNDANAYVTWLAQKTGKPYRLLSEAEYEYATRAETTTAYPWGDAIGTNNANCSRCGSQWDGKMTAPVGSFAVNNLALYDMVGNVWEWTQDCWRDNYTGAPTDGSAWTSGNCNSHIARGGSWNDTPVQLRSAVRNSFSTVIRIVTVGFRVARTLEQ